MQSRLLLATIGFTLLTGCFSHLNQLPDGRHQCDWTDWAFCRRPYDPRSNAKCDPVMAAARQLTVIEDDLRRDGTITIKRPDVWGDRNLMSSLQEFDQLLAQRTEIFSETVQAYIARSDQAELSSSTGIGTSSEGPIPEADRAKAEELAVNARLTDLIKLLGNTQEQKMAAGVEPTELARQHATYIDVCQALRRRHVGDDTCRAAGYALYKFRIPVSVLPGRETSEGHAAVVSIRARLQVDDANLRYTFPKLVVADAVDLLAPIVRQIWNKKQEETKCTPPVCEAPKGEGSAPKYSRPPVDTPLTITDAVDVLGEPTVYSIKEFVKRQFAETSSNQDAPSELEIREAMFRILGQAYSIVEQENECGLTPLALGYCDRNCEQNCVHAAADDLQHGRRNENAQTQWQCQFRERWLMSETEAPTCYWPDACWAVALQAGILDINLKRIVKELQSRGSMSEADATAVDGIYFFPTAHVATGCSPASRYWQTIIKETFPLSVFAIDPQVEEQNVYDAFTRRRELQLALAYNVANSRFNLEEKLKFSRQLGLDQADIDLNRTAVGFSHGHDTFGWYFYPRVQAPPVESTNIGAVTRMIWSTGPTENYDIRHRKLEPGMRECEVLIAMPSFVSGVNFDVTANWECLTHPGVTKRSYEEMLAQGGRVEQLKMCMAGLCESECYRPGDVERLKSRASQIEAMLGMQTYCVPVPYEYEQSGHDLFDTGNAHLRPSAAGFYGLDCLGEVAGKCCDKASFFLTGKNFYPAGTHVIVGGLEGHSLGAMATQVRTTLKTDTGTAPDACKANASTPCENVAATAFVEVISRELLHVQVSGLNRCLSGADHFQVRVATPAGVSNAISIPFKPTTANTVPAAECVPLPAPSAAPVDCGESTSPANATGHSFMPSNGPSHSASQVQITSRSKVASRGNAMPRP